MRNKTLFDDARMTMDETIDKGMIELWRGESWFCVAQFLKTKRIKFFLTNPITGEFRVRHKEKIIYQGADLDKAIEVYNEI